MNSVCKDLYTVLCAADEVDELDNRRSGFWRSLLRWLWTAKTPLKMLAMDAKNAKKIEPDPKIFMKDENFGGSVCKRDWHNVRSYLFFNVRTFRMKNSHSVCNGLNSFATLFPIRPKFSFKFLPFSQKSCNTAFVGWAVVGHYVPAIQPVISHQLNPS